MRYWQMIMMYKWVLLHLFFKRLEDVLSCVYKQMHTSVKETLHDLYSISQGSSHRSVYLEEQEVLEGQDGYR